MIQLPKTESSLWRGNYPVPIYPSLTNEIAVDVVIVGAGITGLTTAYLLKQRGFTVAVLDKDTVGGGTSGRTTGKVSSQHSLIYADLIKRHGQKIAQAYATMNADAVEQVADIIAREKIDCDWSREDNYVYTDDPSQVSNLEAEATAAAKLGLPSTFETTAPLPFPVKGVVKFTGQGKFNAQKYVLGLARLVDGDGSHVYERSHVSKIQDGSPAKVATRQGKVTAQNIIVATNVPTLPLAARGGYCLYEYPQESYIVAGKLPAAQAGMFISPDKPHYSIFPITVDGEPYVLIGGEGHLSGLRGSTTAKYRRLAEYAAKHFGVTEITHRWSDRDYMAYDRLPLIGPAYPWSKHLYVASAYGKWGLSNGTAAGMLLADKLSGVPRSDESVFTPNRLRAVAAGPRAAARYIKERF